MEFKVPLAEIKEEAEEEESLEHFRRRAEESMEYFVSCNNLLDKEAQEVLELGIEALTRRLLLLANNLYTLQDLYGTN